MVLAVRASFLPLVSLVVSLFTSALASSNDVWTIGQPTVSKRLWSRGSEADPSDPVKFAISLAGENFGELDAKMLSIAKERGSWLSTDELKYYTTPSTDSTKEVEKYLAKHGVASHELAYNHLGNIMTVNTTAGIASKMFNTNLHHYTSVQSKQKSVRATQLHLPASLSPHIVHIRDLTTLSVPQHQSGKRQPLTQRREVLTQPASLSRRDEKLEKKAAAASTPVHVQPPGCDDKNVTMPCMADFYGYADYRATVPKGHESVAAINYGLWTDQSVLYFEHVYGITEDKYIPKKLYLGADQTAWDKVTVDDGEGLLDVEMLLGTAYPLEVQVYSSSSDFVQNVQGLIDLPDADRPGVVSISYGQQESDTDISFYRDFCSHVQQLVALGTTFVTASGDNGVSVYNNNNSCPPFQVDMMSACPYVLSVGATTQFSEERAGYEPTKPDVHNGWSSGGFSNYEPTPSWQKSHVDNYLTLNKRQYSQYYNTSGRGWPDISAFGQYVDTAGINTDGPYFYLDGGTSASSPIVAGVLGLVNSKCKDAGKGRIGWIHPTLYANPGATNDITKGGAYLCEHDSFNSPLGLPCEKGWDPVTGMGSPNFPGLVQAFGCE